MARSGSPGLGDRNYSSIGSAQIGQVLEIAVGHTAVVGHASAVAADVVAVTWIYAACCRYYWGCSATVYTSAQPAYHHFSDSSCTTHWASESGIASYIVCFTDRAGVLVVCFASDSPSSSLHPHCYGLHSALELFSASD